MKALGANPVAWSDLAGLDGIEMDVASIAGNKYDQSAKSLTGNVVFWARPSVIFANAKWFDGLPPDQQQLMRTVASDVHQRSVARVAMNARDAVDLMCRRAIKITTASSQALAELRSRTKSVMDELEKDAGTKATIDAIDALRGPATGSDTVAPCSQVLASTSPGSGLNSD